MATALTDKEKQQKVEWFFSEKNNALFSRLASAMPDGAISNGKGSKHTYIGGDVETEIEDYYTVWYYFNLDADERSEEEDSASYFGPAAKIITGLERFLWDNITNITATQISDIYEVMDIIGTEFQSVTMFHEFLDSNRSYYGIADDQILYGETHNRDDYNATVKAATDALTSKADPKQITPLEQKPKEKQGLVHIPITAADDEEPVSLPASPEIIPELPLEASAESRAHSKYLRDAQRDLDDMNHARRGRRTSLDDIIKERTEAAGLNPPSTLSELHDALNVAINDNTPAQVRMEAALALDAECQRLQEIEGIGTPITKAGIPVKGRRTANYIQQVRYYADEALAVAVSEQLQTNEAAFAFTPLQNGQENNDQQYVADAASLQRINHAIECIQNVDMRNPRSKLQDILGNLDTLKPQLQESANQYHARITEYLHSKLQGNDNNIYAVVQAIRTGEAVLQDPAIIGNGNKETAAMIHDAFAAIIEHNNLQPYVFLADVQTALAEATPQRGDEPSGRVERVLSRFNPFVGSVNQDLHKTLDMVQAQLTALATPSEDQLLDITGLKDALSDAITIVEGKDSGLGGRISPISFGARGALHKALTQIQQDLGKGQESTLLAVVTARTAHDVSSVVKDAKGKVLTDAKGEPAHLNSTEKALNVLLADSLDTLKQDNGADAALTDKVKEAMELEGQRR